MSQDVAYNTEIINSGLHELETDDNFSIWNENNHDPK